MRPATDRILAAEPAPPNRPEVQLLHVGLLAVVEQLQAVREEIADLCADLEQQAGRAEDDRATLLGGLRELRDELSLRAPAG